MGAVLLYLLLGWLIASAILSLRPALSRTTLLWLVPLLVIIILALFFVPTPPSHVEHIFGPGRS